MRFARLCALSALFAVPVIGVRLAAADDVPTSLVERPLSLEPSTMQPSFAATFNRANGENGEALVFGADYGVLHHLQIGAVVDVAVSPKSDFVRGLVNGQYQFLAFAAARVDIGAQRVGEDVGFAVGVGLPLRLKLAESLALISSRPNAYGAEDDILTLTTAGSTTTTFRIPVGILYQLDKHLSFAVRSGFASRDSAQFIPLGLDFTVSVSRLDFGATFDLPGQIAPDMAPGYFDALTLRAFAQFRLW
jgi:hypothetical protein